LRSIPTSVTPRSVVPSTRSPSRATVCLTASGARNFTRMLVSEKRGSFFACATAVSASASTSAARRAPLSRPNILLPLEVDAASAAPSADFGL
jgi:hypothetical protein